MFFRALALNLVLSAGGLFGQANDSWIELFPPHRVIGNVYYVGSRGLASYLITTPDGHILLNSGLESTPPLIRASVEKLGFKFSDIKILLISHAHWDHCAGSALIKELTAAGAVSGRAQREATGHALAMAFGPGLTIELVLLQIDKRTEA